MASKTIRQAEKKALDGANESQDTLLLAHHLMVDYGVGLTSSSPVAEEMMAVPSPRRRRPSSQKSSRNSDLVHLDNAGNTDDTRGTRHSSIPETQAHQSPYVRVWDDANDDGVVGSLNLPDALPASADIDSTSRRKMDSTQGSTQSNVGRSYDQYRRASSTGRESPHPQPARSPEPAPHSPTCRGEPGDDVGVQSDFARATAAHDAISPAQDDSGFVDFGNLTHLRHLATQKTPQSPSQQFPETPGPPQNPFRNSRSQLLPASQLFRGTQFSSPIKPVSPTSSRPSPADFPGNSVSPNPVISSPLKARGLRSTPPAHVTSSPEVLPGTASSRLNGRACSPANTSSAANAVVPESSRDGQSWKRMGPDPMSIYEPMRESQERRAISELPCDQTSSAEDDDRYDSIARRRKAKAKKEAALKQLTAISFLRPPKTDGVKVPSTSRRKRTSQAEACIAQGQGKDPASKESDDPPSAEERPRRMHTSRRRIVVDSGSTQSEPEDEEAPPTLDPTPNARPELPQSSTKSATHLARISAVEGMSNGDAIPETSPTSGRAPPLPEVAPSVGPVPTAGNPTPDFQSSPPAFSTRSRRSKTRKGFPRALSPTSSLSNLASTPQLPSSSPPEVANTAPTASPTESTIVTSSSPVAAQKKRPSAREKLPNLRTDSTERLRQSARVTRRGSNSTDELARSASGTPTFEQSLRVSRLSVSRSASRSGRGAARSPPTPGDSKLFDTMAFAISFQSRKPGESNEQYSVRMDFSATIHKRIKQAGGRILENGFDELFEVSPIEPSSSPTSSPGEESEITLTPDGRAMGFTALIADGHSRKVKYMQALALGLPCIAARWVTMCLERKELVDWTPYLLCAGQSTFLGDAIRSRSLSPYDAATARLADVVRQREKLLDGSRILAVVKKASESRKMAYVFLARVLGASLTRVCNVEEGKAEMKAAEAAGRPFDWVYVDGKAEENALFRAVPGPGSAPGKKRKRASTSASASAASLAAQLPPAKRVRTLTDELVIQSLILGRLIEEGDMDG